MAQAKTLTSAELVQVLLYISQHPHAARNRLMLLLTTWAGLRVGEVAALRVSDVRNADGGVRAEVFLAAERTKHHHARTVFINQRLQAEIQAYLGTRNWCSPDLPLFYTQKSCRNGFSASTLCQHFHALYRRAGIPGASSHSGRRTFITNLASQGVAVRVLASLAGHRSIQTTQRYIDVNDDQKRRAVELA